MNKTGKDSFLLDFMRDVFLKNYFYIILGLVILLSLYSVGFVMLDLNGVVGESLNSELMGESHIFVKNADNDFLKREFV